MATGFSGLSRTRAVANHPSAKAPVQIPSVFLAQATLAIRRIVKRATLPPYAAADFPTEPFLFPRILEEKAHFTSYDKVPSNFDSATYEAIGLTSPQALP